MPNPIKTSADQIVEKYKPYAMDSDRGNYSIDYDPQIHTEESTRCAILEVEACIELLEKMTHVTSNPRGIEFEIEMQNQILSELKSRIV